VCKKEEKAFLREQGRQINMELNEKQRLMGQNF
jgi:hypothetical protein